MTIALHGTVQFARKIASEPYLVRIAGRDSFNDSARRAVILRGTNSLGASDFPDCIFLANGASPPQGATCDVVHLPSTLSYLEEGDIVRLNPVSDSVRVLFRKGSKHNTVLITEQCNNYCLMCSQPPKSVDDSWLLNEAFELVAMMPPTTTDVGFSGGEPTLFRERFVTLLERVRDCLPIAAVDVLSNGRAFSDYTFAKKYASVRHPNLVTGIPLYSDDAERHDYVVQSRGAFDETVRGILNLKRLSERVEIRIVLHRQTIDRLVDTCRFIARNLLFVDHVALMGLEMMGFARANLDKLWIDPHDYRDALSESVRLLNSYRIPTSVYNHQLCVVNEDVYGNYVKSISDWKTEYLDLCECCSRRERCGGLFASAALHRYSDHIHPFE